MPVRKEDKKASGFQISHLYLPVLSDIIAVKGLRLLLFSLLLLGWLIFLFYRYRGKRNQLPVLPLQGYMPVLQQLQLILSVWTNLFGLQHCLDDTVVRILMTCLKNYDVNCHSLTSFCKLGSMLTGLCVSVMLLTREEVRCAFLDTIFSEIMPILLRVDHYHNI